MPFNFLAMANEVTITVSLQVSKSGVTNVLSRANTRDFQGTNQISQVQSIANAPELLVIGDLGNINHLAVLNIGDTNPVRLSLDAEGAQVFAELKPGDICYLPLKPGVTQIYAATTAGASDIAVLAIES